MWRYIEKTHNKWFYLALPKQIKKDNIKNDKFNEKENKKNISYSKLYWEVTKWGNKTETIYL